MSYIVFALGRFSNLVQCLWAMTGAHPIVEHLKKVGSILSTKHWARLERLARDKHSNLLQTIIKFAHEKVL
jgi:hypothetical protein